MAGGLGLTALAQRLGRAALLPWGAGLLALCWLAELQWSSPVPPPLRTTSIEVPALFQELAANPAGGAVFLVNRRAELDRLLQTFHQRPILSQWGVNGWTTGDATADRFISLLDRGEPFCQAEEAGVWAARLRALGVEWVVDLPGFSSCSGPRHRRCLDHMLGIASRSEPLATGWWLMEPGPGDG